MNRYSRDSDILTEEVRRTTPIAIIGVGAVGHALFRMLVCMGFTQLRIVDFDTVSDENLGPQCYAPISLGWPKVEACGAEGHDLNSEVQIFACCERFKPEHINEGDIVCCCVDDMQVRKSIWTQFQRRGGSLFIESRMAAEEFEVRTHTPGTIGAWLPSWFPQEEAPPIRCSSKATAYCANACAAFMVAQLSKYLRKIPIDPFISLDLICPPVPTPG